MTLRLRLALLRRWALDVSFPDGLSFERHTALLNLRRVELACLLGLVTDAIGVAIGLRNAAFTASLPTALLFIALADWTGRTGRLRAQQAVTITFVTAAFVSRLWGGYVVGQHGRISDGYPMTLLTLTLLLVIHPRTLLPMVAVALTGYSMIVWQIAVPRTLILGAIVNATLVSGISLVAAWVIYNARRADHEQQRQIRAQNVELDELMAITAHDLRSPLFGLRNLLQLASDRDDRPALAQRALREGVYCLDSMLALVSRLLEAHRAEYGTVRPAIAADVAPALRASVRRMGPAAEFAGVTVTVDLPADAIVARHDPDALGQILDNVLGNAIRFAPRGTAVRLACVARVGDVAVTVEDGGPGVAPADRATLFNKFHRHGSRPQGGSGAGMGLFIAATLAQRMDATLSFHPVQPHGAMFLLSLAR